MLGEARGQNGSGNASALQEIVPLLEKARDLAQSADQRFLTYLIDLALIETRALLKRNSG